MLHSQCLENLKGNKEVLKKIQEENKVKLSWDHQRERKDLKSNENILVYEFHWNFIETSALQNKLTTKLDSYGNIKGYQSRSKNHSGILSGPCQAEPYGRYSQNPHSKIIS